MSEVTSSQQHIFDPDDAAKIRLGLSTTVLEKKYKQILKNKRTRSLEIQAKMATVGITPKELQLIDFIRW